MSMLLEHADILCRREDGWQTIRDAYLGIAGGFIRYIGAQPPEEPYAQRKSMAGKLLMPGLYNMHTHTPMTLLRGLGSDLPLDRWLHEAMFPVEARLTAEDVAIGTRIALMEMLSSGVVSFSDMYYFTEATLKEVEKAGLKANLNRPMLAEDPAEPYGENTRAQDSIALFKAYHGAADGRILVDFAIHAEYTSHPAAVRAYAEDCRRYGARMHLHLSETKKEHEECKQRHGKTPARYFYDLGAFDSPTIAAHCVMVEREDMALLAEKGVTAVHNPTSNMKLGSGFMPAQALLEAGVALALGTDGAASNNNLNMLEEMHLAAIIHNGYTQDPTIMNPAQVLDMATGCGARAQGRADCGALEAGMRADMIAINLDAPHLMPVLDVPALVVYAAQASDVEMTMVDGTILYENGEFLTIDRDRARHDLQKAVQRLY